MSWFTQALEHPALAALSALAGHPAVQANPGFAAAVQKARDDATIVAATVTASAHTVASQMQTDVDPILKALHLGVQDALDAALTAYLGPVGTALTPAANAALVLLEDRLHGYIAALFGHVKAQA